jgi:predicted transcriptional regulator of viral defense system
MTPDAPINPPIGTATHQHAILSALVPNACMTLDEIAEASGVPRLGVPRAVNRLILRGFVERIARGCIQLTQAGATALAEGTPLNSGPIAPHRQMNNRSGSARERFWQAIRLRQKFTLADLQILALKDGEQGYSNIRIYVGRLEKAGYLRALMRDQSSAISTMSRGQKRWALVRDSGPCAPITRQRGGAWEVFDPNTQEAHPCR